MGGASARDRADAGLGHRVEPDGVRRVVEMKRGDLVWRIDVGESESDAHARMIAESMSDDNGGGWKFSQVLDSFPHENVKFEPLRERP